MVIQHSYGKQLTSSTLSKHLLLLTCVIAIQIRLGNVQNPPTTTPTTSTASQTATSPASSTSGSSGSSTNTATSGSVTTTSGSATTTSGPGNQPGGPTSSGAASPGATNGNGSPVASAGPNAGGGGDGGLSKGDEVAITSASILTLSTMCDLHNDQARENCEEEFDMTADTYARQQNESEKYNFQQCLIECSSVGIRVQRVLMFTALFFVTRLW